MSSLYDNTTQASNQLNRELLRWIQSLDLAYSIKNVKRDFSNGFLVAEIMSRYYDKDISMHSYDNGIGVKVKKDNWDQLHRVFSRVADLEPLTNRTEMDAVIHCQNGAAVGFLTKLYQCLTKRTIQPSVAPPSMNGASGSHATSGATAMAKGRDAVDEIPPYAKPTGAAVIREKMRGADIAEVSDETEIHRKVRSIHSQHEEQLQLERLLAMDTPERYPSLRSASKATVLRGATKPVRNDESPALLTHTVVKEVQIKSMNEKSLEKLRLNREAQENESSSHGSSYGPSGTRGNGSPIAVSFDHSTRHGHGSGNGNGMGGGTGAGELIQKRRPMDLLNEAVGRKLPPAIASKIEQRGKDKFDAFVDALLLHDDDHDGATDAHVATLSGRHGADLLTEILDDTHVLALAFLDFPRDFWRVAGVLLPLLTQHDDDHVLFVAVHHALLRLGSHCVKRDATAALLLMTDYLLPAITPVLATHATKRAPLLQIMYAFVSSTVLAHIQVIKRLREALPPTDMPLFIHALSILLYMEPVLDDTLVDLYYYYCCIGLETPCDKLRAASLSMLVPFLRYDVSLVVDLLPRLTQFSSRHAWWEVKTQLVIVASAFLHAVSASSSSPTATAPSRDFTDQIELALTILEREFHPSASLNVRRVGLSYLAKNLSQYQELVPLYVDVLLSVPLAMRALMMQSNRNQHQNQNRNPETDEMSQDRVTPPTTNTLPIRGTSGAHYELLALAPQWDSVAIAKQIFYERKGRNHADVDALHVLHACFSQLLAREATTADASALYDQMRGYIVLGLADAAACGITGQLLADVVASSVCATEEVLAHDALVAVLQTLVTPNVDDIRQQSAVKMLHDVHMLGGRHAVAVRRCVQSLAMLSVDAFKQSLFSVAFESDS